MRAWLLLLAALALAACDDKPKRPPPTTGGGAVGVIDLTASSQWELRYSPGMPPVANLSAGLALPTTDGLHYVVHHVSPLTSQSHIAMDFTFTGSCRPVEPGDSSAARITLFLAAQDYQLDWAPKRFWTASTLLTPGRHLLDAPLNGAQWTTVNGTSDPGAFASALRMLGYVGFTTGGQGFGHGIACEEGSTLTLHTYRVE